MPTTGRTAARNYRDRRTLTSSSDSESTPERLHFKPLPQGSLKRQNSPSRTPRGFHSQRSRSARPVSRGRGQRAMKRGQQKLRMPLHPLKPGGPPLRKRSHSPRRSEFSPPRKSSHQMGDFERGHGSKREEYMKRKNPKGPGDRKHHPDGPSGVTSRLPLERDMPGKYRMEDKYRGGGGPSTYVPPRESDHPPSHMKMDMDMRDRDMRHPHDVPMFPNKDRNQRGRDGMQGSPLRSQSFIGEKKGMRSDDYGRGDHSPDRGPTLDERFRHSTEKPSDSRMHYNRQELEKITIDIRRNVREPSPTVRRIVNPEEIKVVRRPGEGHRPLFEREEIKKPLSDLREDASFERRVSISKRDMDMNDDYSMNRKHPVPDSGYLEPSRQSLSDRWQGERKGSMPMSRMQRDVSEERNPPYKRSVSPLGYRNQDYQGSPMNRNIGRDHPRDERPLDRGPPRRSRERSIDDRRDEGDRDFMRPFLDDPGDLRYSLSRRKEGSFGDDRRRSSERSHERRETKDRSHYRDSSGKNSLDISSGRYRESRSRHRSRSRSPMFDRERNRDSSRDGRGTDFSQRPDRFKTAPWDMKPEHDDRGDRDRDFNNRRRGRGRMMRSRGFRGRMMRGGLRGNFRGRMFRGNMNRGRPFYRRGIGGRSSPRQWEHDLFNKMSPEKTEN